MNLPDAISLEGRVVLVTGASSGIGLAATRVLRQLGARVCPSGLEPAAQLAGPLVAELGPDYGAVDVRDPQQLEALVDRVVKAHGRLDAVLSNAGNMTTGTAEETSYAQWDETIAVNLRSHFALAKRALPELASSRGSLTFTASELGLVGARSAVAYCAAKAGLINMTRALAVDAAPRVRVNAIAPGPVETPMLTRWLESAEDPAGLREAQLGPVPLRRFASPEEIGHAAAFLASDAAGFITGTVLAVDGGATASYGL